MNKNKSVIGFVGLILVGFISALDLTIVAVTMPKIQQYFKTSLDDIMWITLMFSLVSTSFLITMAKLGDIFGRKKIVIFSLIVFVISSAICGFSKYLWVIILGRGLQGLGSAGISTVAIAIALNMFPKEKSNITAGVWAAFQAIAIAIGPSLGGYISEYLNWRYIFFINVPIGILSLVLIYRFIDETYDEASSKKIDFVGIVLITVCLSTFTYMLTKVNTLGYYSMTTILLTIISIVSLTLFIIIEKKSDFPLVDFSLFKIRSFTSSTVVLGLYGVSTILSFNLINFYFNSIFNYTTLESGNILFFFAIGIMLSAIVAAILTFRFKVSTIVIFSVIINIIGIFLLSTTTPSTSKNVFIAYLFIAGIGVGGPTAQLFANALKDVPSEKIGLASGLSNVIPKAFSLIITAILICVLTSNLGNAFDKTKVDLINKFSSTDTIDNSSKEYIISRLKIMSKENYLQVENEIENKLKSSIATNLKNLPLDNQKEIIEKQKEMFTFLDRTIKESNTSLKSNGAKAYTDTFKFGITFLILTLILSFLINPKNSISTSKKDLQPES